MNIPSNLHYTKEHEWIRVEGNEAYVGITDYAQSELGEIVFVDINTEGETLAQEEALDHSVGCLHSNKERVGDKLAGSIRCLATVLVDGSKLRHSDCIVLRLRRHCQQQSESKESLFHINAFNYKGCYKENVSRSMAVRPHRP